jgi:hypothetical protein
VLKIISSMLDVSYLLGPIVRFIMYTKCSALMFMFLDCVLILLPSQMHFVWEDIDWCAVIQVAFLVRWWASFAD